MLVFIDESGCPGFKLDRDSDPVFVIGMATFATSNDARTTEGVIADLRTSIGHRSEFKFSKCRDETRDAFLRAVRGCAFTVRAVVVDKRTVSPLVNGKEFYGFFANALLELPGDTLRSASVRIDGINEREAMRTLRRYFSSKLRGRVRAIRLSDSRSDSLIQLTDMCVGAIARAYRNRPCGDRWFNLIRPRIAGIREFK